MALLSGYSRGDGCGLLQKERKPVLPSSLTYDDNKISITKLLDKLEEIWNHIESKKDEMEMICKENKRLLKPLPKQIVEKEEKREESENYLPSSEVPFESEIEDLNLINKVLEKAQKTRKKHQNKTGGDSRHVDEKICEGSLNDKRKPESFSDNSQNLGTSQMTVDPSQIGVISEKELTKALLNVRVSKSKTTHQKAPYKTMDSECRKVMPNKNQSKSRFHVTKSLDHPKDDAIHSLKNKSSSGSFKEKKPQCLRKTSKLEEQDIIESVTNENIIESVTNENRNSPLYVIPPEIKDLCCQNQRLKKMAHKVKKKDDSKFSRSFLQLWEKKMTKTPNNEWKLVTEKYNKLFTLLQSLNLTSISDSLSPEEIFEMKIALEYILTSMYDLNEQTKRLLKKAKSQLRVDDITPEMEEFKLYPNVPQEIWLPSPSLQLLDSDFFDCWTNSSSLKLNYSSLEELDRYWDQHHKLQESLLSQYLIKIIFQSFLPILKSQHLQQREKMFLYRFLSGFLHHNGKHFPVLIES